MKIILNVAHISATTNGLERKKKENIFLQINLKANVQPLKSVN